jgi:Flp pilus assembly protein TadG
MDESGFVLVFVSLVLAVLLLASAALVVDLGDGRQAKAQAQGVADAAALSGAAGLTDVVPDAVMQAFTYAFKSQSLTPPPSIAATSACGPNCWSYASSGTYVQVATPWKNLANSVHVRVCWTRPVVFARTIGFTRLDACAAATAQNDNISSTGAGPPAASSCTSNELSTTTNNPIPTNGRLTALYNASQPIDTNGIVFIAPDQFGNLVRLTNTGDPNTGYALTQNGNTATITYQLPAGLPTATASLFVHDTQQNDCGQVAWSSCPVSTHDDFFETINHTTGIGDHGLGLDGDPDDILTGSAKANAALLADADDSVFPSPGQQVTAGASLGATYYDETPIDPARADLFLNGELQNATLSPAPPPNTVDNTGIGQVSAKVSTIQRSTNTVTVQLRDYLGDPIRGKTVTITNLSAGNVNPTSRVSGPDGKATFTLSQSTATFTVVDQTDSLTIVGGSPPVAWPHQTTYSEQISTTLTSATANGWNSAFLYVFDGDVNQQGGDCSLTQFAFRFAGGTPSNSNAISLTE